MNVIKIGTRLWVIQDTLSSYMVECFFILQLFSQSFSILMTGFQTLVCFYIILGQV